MYSFLLNTAIAGALPISTLGIGEAAGKFVPSDEAVTYKAWPGSFAWKAIYSFPSKPAMAGAPPIEMFVYRVAAGKLSVALAADDVT